MSDAAFYSYVGSAIQGARVAAGMSQKDLANAISLSRTSIANIEAGRQRLLIHQLFDIAKILRAQPDTLLPPFAGQLRDVILIGKARKRSPRVLSKQTTQGEKP